MKNKLTLSLLLSLFAYVAMHASDADKRLEKFILRRFANKLVTIQSHHFNVPFTIDLFFHSEAQNIHTCKHVPIFTYNEVAYMVTNVQKNCRVTITADSEKITGLTTKVTITPTIST
jgi:hypothetical protein